MLVLQARLARLARLAQEFETVGAKAVIQHWNEFLGLLAKIEKEDGGGTRKRVRRPQGSGLAGESREI